MAVNNIYAFYNNKGGVGKTTLCQNAASLFAEENPDQLVLVIDLCPQANISQFFLGGAHAGYNANQRLQSQATRRNVVGFMDWLIKGNSGFTSLQMSYMTPVSQYNKNISDNLYLIAGDSFLESQALALNFATMNPGNINAWKEYVTAIERLCALELQKSDYQDMTVFIDCNPSFSIYTQMALVSSTSLVVPMMADYSSLEGIKGILMLLYGKYPSAAAQTYASTVITFASQIKKFGLQLPTIYELPFNNYTVNSGVATAYGSIRRELIDYAYQQYLVDPSIFATPTNIPSNLQAWENLYISDVKDFHTAGKVSSSLGIPLHRLEKQNSYKMPNGKRVGLPKDNYKASLKNLRDFVKKL
ncbi:ATPase [Pseudomonas syringae pv. tomato]|uniref:ParA family protein n=2 Tax=Pseudomonas syringae group TaxID=136849 RepID=A0AAW4DTN0_PSESX|nr:MULTISPECIES: ParA family protein [Pseudomonas syringae group]AVI84815.1 ATPase [Pseudomonas syringae pv. tomato]EEB57234.1 ATPase domain protein [Pseudomonas syringae pv. tomato T1]KGK93836.1 ATPase [Pseudomonas syringae pv. tomato]KUR39794.1 CobQ/CobB/MinD/ParA nucleotide binding domain protein [Pseudomonas syringae pv. tomato]KUR42624.1 CobQ/CobB/MinD/ParA nucleotide binding domain protein [Pseudomonas syringae pv. tomato]